MYLKAKKRSMKMNQLECTVSGMAETVDDIRFLSFHGYTLMIHSHWHLFTLKTKAFSNFSCFLIYRTKLVLTALTCLAVLTEIYACKHWFCPIYWQAYLAAKASASARDCACWYMRILPVSMNFWLNNSTNPNLLSLSLHYDRFYRFLQLPN